MSCGPLTPDLEPRAPPMEDGTRQATLPGHPFSRSYGVKLPSSLTGDRSSTSREFPLPTSVGVRYGRLRLRPLLLAEERQA